jgi:hypothetical protein
MIASPCRDCENIDCPKDDCVKTCPRLLGVQQIAATQPGAVFVAIDYADDIRFSLANRTALPRIQP